MIHPALSRRSAFAAVMLLVFVVLLHLSDGAVPVLAQSSEQPSTNLTQVIALQGTNWWVAPRGAADWVLASTQMPQTVRVGDRIRTGRGTRLFLRTPHLGVIQIPPLSTVEISAPPGETKSLWVRLLEGMLYFFHRGSPSDVEVQTRGASAAIRGTEFVAEARDDGGLIIRVVDGAVALRNEQGSVLLEKGEEGVAPAGQVPSRTPALYANQVIQWCLYYPAVVDADEIPLSAAEKDALVDSLAAYRAGDLVAALMRYPADRQPQSAPERVYLAALWLAVGQVPHSETLLEEFSVSVEATTVPARLAGSIRLMAAATRGQARPPSPSSPELASEWLAESYYLQAEGNLGQAREAARQATVRAPRFGFAWARLAELEFGFGRVEAASAALQTALELAPRHAAAVALEGFQWCARNKIAAAEVSFNKALELDPGLGNAWLGRGLCRIRRGQLSQGLADLEVAAAAEPQRALLRSYLGKAFAEAGDARRAEKEFTLAKTLDPEDPTGWLYAALFAQQQNRINDGIRDLETSKRLNDNRSLYRSRHLLDQDQAVRGANLSAIYRDAGFVDLSRREAVDAVNTDYANYSAHLFLANSYNELRDPGQVDLRYETAWFSEYLLANLLAPVGAGTLSQTVSAQEFSRLFEGDGVGLASLTEYGSNGDWIQSAAQYGLLGNFAYALEGDYRSNNGQRRNSALEQVTLGVKVKQQITPDDSVFFQATYYDADGGDVARVYNPKDPAYFHPGYRFEENQEPLLLGGYHHQWGPGQHTLALAGRLHDRLHVTDPTQPVLLVGKDPSDAVTGTILTSAEQRYRSDLEIYHMEVQHIAQMDPWTLVLGARSQLGRFNTENNQQNLRDQGPSLPVPLHQELETDLRRLTAYGYAQWQVFEPFFLSGGLSYDSLQYPENYRFAPLSSGEQTRNQWSPKAGFLWKITPASTLRAAYTRSLSGASLEQSIRLEPSQVAGFNQAWRSLIPESVAGAQAGARLESGSLEWDYRFPTETYLAIRGDVNRSSLRRQVGVFDLEFLAEPATTPEELDFRETSLNVTLNQMLGKGLALGAHYRLSNAQLEDVYPLIPGSVPALFPPYELRPRQELESTLHQVLLFAVYNHESGCFGRLESLWSSQSNQGYQPGRPGDEFWQFNAFVGYRFPRRRAEIQVGLLNLTDQDYRLNPLNLTAELPRSRTFTASLRLNF